MVDVIWTPSIQLIDDITNTVNAVVTTVNDYNFEDGQYVLINVDPIYGMSLSNVRAKIKLLTSDTFETDLDLSTQVAFSPPLSGFYTPANVTEITGFYRNATPGGPSP